jgi:hypothetical protein
MADITKRVQITNAYTSLVDRLINWGPAVITTLGAGGLSGVAAWATASLAAYAPVSWVACGFAGALICTLVLWLWSLVRLRLQSYRVIRQFHEHHAPLINPLDSVFTNKIININDFAPAIPGRPAIGKSFVDCEIVGPAWVILNGLTSLNDLEIIDCDFVKIKAMHPISSAIAFENISIRRCKLYRITFLIPEYLVGTIPPGANWITT